VGAAEEQQVKAIPRKKLFGKTRFLFSQKLGRGRLTFTRSLHTHTHYTKHLQLPFNSTLDLLVKRFFKSSHSTTTPPQFVRVFFQRATSIPPCNKILQRSFRKVLWNVNPWKYTLLTVCRTLAKLRIYTCGD